MRILITGGGTGGHLFPGLALAEEFQARDDQNVILFVGTKSGIEQKILPSRGFDLKTIWTTGLLGKGLLQQALGIAQCFVGILQAMMVIRHFRPDIVLGTGGYVSFPVIAAAYCMGIETAICEQNSIPGLTNRILGRLVKTVFVAFEASLRFFPKGKTVISGNPVRREFRARSCSAPKKNEGRFCLLVLGGSQGAHSINKKMVDALPTLRPIRDKLKVIHQTGVQDYEWVQETYGKHHMPATILPFISDMVSAYAQADLVISRAGAITISEFLICGKPSLLIPYPFAAHNHQEVNAKMLVEKGAAQVLLDRDTSGEQVGEAILHFLAHPEALKEMSRRALSLSQPEAADVIVNRYFPIPEGR
ncbi:MAG: undecaprenyldiphospho-muramoylpentapeptide beta-N-acetylglucosaminyltransferase [Deltaproteobacteria bacterium]|nr:undecaprenyldiphospho-muramoylpentapeptide beta-N-acetylglucosaminyltransferase [Deltaproteobacteria bacterium]